VWNEKGRYGPLDPPRPGREARGRLAETQRADLSVTPGPCSPHWTQPNNSLKRSGNSAAFIR
jgi:hypothetical protein